MKNIFGRRKGISGLVSRVLVTAACAAFVVPAVLAMEGVRRLSQDEATEADKRESEEQK